MTTQKNGATARTVSPEKQPGKTAKQIQLTLFPIKSPAPVQPTTEPLEMTLKQCELLWELLCHKDGMRASWIKDCVGPDYKKTITQLRKLGFGITCEVIQYDGGDKPCWKYKLISAPTTDISIREQR